MVDALEATAESSTCISWSDAVDQLLCTDADQFIPTNHQWFDQPYNGLFYRPDHPGRQSRHRQKCIGFAASLGAVTAGAKPVGYGRDASSGSGTRSMAVMPQLPLGVKAEVQYG